MLVLDLFYFILLLFSWPFWLKYLLKRSYRSLLQGRLRPQMPACGEKPVWIHAVSVGEVRSLKSLVEELGKADWPVVLSVTTPAGFTFARREFPGLQVILAPLDLSFIIRRFIGRIQPRLVVFNELEIWPNWISLLRRRRVPMMLINGRISQAAFRRYRAFRLILQPFFRSIDRYLVQNDLYRQRFLRLGIPADKITVCGNIKADEADSSLRGMPASVEVRAHLRLPEQAGKIVVLASSHEDDEKVFIPAIPVQSDTYFFIIVPRHVQRSEAIAAHLQRSGVRNALFSRQESPDSGIQAMVYDLMGYLFPIMSIAYIVFMGGTFTAGTGGHNLYEPAALGKAIVGGPYYDNFPEIGRELEERGVYHRVHNSDEWLGFLQTFPGTDLKRIKDNALETLRRRKGALACSLEQIHRYLA
jgi:3-deoxy-D-manno-octulosonic-acid transferase